MTQVSIPVTVRPDEVARKASLGAAIELCAELAGFGLDSVLSLNDAFGPFLPGGYGLPVR